MRERIIVTGGRGRLARVLKLVGGEAVLALSRSDLDVTNAADVHEALARLKPSALINAAATSSIEAAETNPDVAFQVNAVAPGILADWCAAENIPFIHVSTDYVFGAQTEQAWTEQDPVSPVNAYGRTKAEGERRVLLSRGNVCVVRVAWLFGDGEDFISALLNKAASQPVKVAYDQIGSPTPIAPLALRLIELARRMSVREADLPPILHLAGTPPVSRADWVEAAFNGLNEAGRTAPPLERVPMSWFKSSAIRPQFSALNGALSATVFGSALLWKPDTILASTFSPRP